MQVVYAAALFFLAAIAQAACLQVAPSKRWWVREAQALTVLLFVLAGDIALLGFVWRVVRR